jgi:hypothetical protein
MPEIYFDTNVSRANTLPDRYIYIRSISSGVIGYAPHVLRVSSFHQIPRLAIGLL